MQFGLLAATWWLNSRGEDPNQLSVARQAGDDVLAAHCARAHPAAGSGGAG